MRGLFKKNLSKSKGFPQSAPSADWLLALIYAITLDVASVEPLPADHPFAAALQLDNFILTPHQAWMSAACLKELIRQYKENVESFFKGEKVRRIV